MVFCNNRVSFKLELDLRRLLNYLRLHCVNAGQHALVDVLDLRGNLSLEVSTSETPPIVIASQLLIRHLIRELQLVYLNLLDLLDYHLDVLHDHLLGGPFHGDFD